MKEKMDKLDFLIKQIFTKMGKLKTKPSDCPDEELLAAYIEDSLSQKDKSKIEEHLLLCSECIDTLAVSSKVAKEVSSSKKSFVTNGMKNKAKGLVKSRYETPFWEKVSDWLNSLNAVPVMATVSAVLIVMVVSIYNFKLINMPSREIPLSLSLNIVAKIPAEETRALTQEYDEIEIEEGGLLNSGNLFKIKFQLEEEAYVCLISLDSKGNMTKLYPERDIGAPVKLEPQKEYFYPREDSWLKLDDNEGQESFYLLASLEPIQDIDSKIDQLKKAGIDEISEIFPMAKIQSFVFKHE